MTMTAYNSQTRRPSRIIALTIGWLGGAAVVALICARLFVFEPFRVPSTSMFPTIPGDSIVITDKRGFAHVIPFRFVKLEPTASPARGDIIVFYLRDGSTAYVKRVIGLPGDHVVVRNRQLIINGVDMPMRPGERMGQYQLAIQTLDERQFGIAWLNERPSKDFDGTVPEGHYFTLGDSRDNARDSRFAEVGYVPKDAILGRVIKVLSFMESDDAFARTPQ